MTFSFFRFHRMLLPLAIGSVTACLPGVTTSVPLGFVASTVAFQVPGPVPLPFGLLVGFCQVAY
jgi:hypothetical protein